MRTRRVARRRVAALGAPASASIPTGYRSRRLRARSDPLTWIGASTRLAMRTTGWVVDSGVNRSDDRFRGAAVLAGVVLVGVSPLGALVVASLGWQVPRILQSRRSRVWQRRLTEETLFAVELCGVAVHTGATIPQTIEAVGPCLNGRLGEALVAANAAYRRGMLLEVALRQITADLGEVVAPLINVLCAAQVDGDRVGPTLERLADRMRAEHRRMVEADARGLSIRLLVPLVCCSLPGFVLIGVVPVAIGALGGLPGSGVTAP